MNVDKFTKIVLTVIAVNLTILTVKNLDIISNANANKPNNNLRFTPSINNGIVPLNEDGSINVKLSNTDEIDVNITSISTSDKLNVLVKKVDALAFSMCTVPVKVK